MHLNLLRYCMLALSILGSATLLFSCNSKPERTVYDYETLLTEMSENRTITMMENGKRSYTFTTPLMEGYSMASNPYQEFRRGIKMTTYTDTLSLVDATITANYAIYYERQKLWEAKGNVVIVKNNRDEGDTTVTSLTEIYTQQLFWNATTKKIYSNVDTKLVKGNNVFVGERFESDEDFKDWRFYYQKSRMEVNVTPGEGVDSTAKDTAVSKPLAEEVAPTDRITTSWEPQVEPRKHRVRAKGDRGQLKPLAIEPLEDAQVELERKAVVAPQSINVE